MHERDLGFPAIEIHHGTGRFSLEAQATDPPRPDSRNKPDHLLGAQLDRRVDQALQGVEGIAIVQFDKRDVVRHPLVQRIVSEGNERFQNSLSTTVGAENARPQNAQPRIRSKIPGDELTADAASKPGADSNSFESPWPVSELSEKLANYIKRLGTVWIEGELTKPSVRGTTFFAELRDLREDMAVGIHSFSSASFPKDLVNGDRVAVLVKPEFWKKSGKMSMQIQDLRKVGLGELLERIQRLREKLTAEGLTDPARKQPIPFLPNCVGLITGKDSDAEKDVLQNAKLRWPDVKFRVINTKVTDKETAKEKFEDAVASGNTAVHAER